MPRLVRRLLATWLVLLALGHVAALAVVWWIFVRTPQGQVLDATALLGTSIGRERVSALVATLLDAVSVVSLIAATVAIGFVALARRRFLLAVVATVLIAGANLTTQVLKRGMIDRPDVGIEGTNIGAPNSLPSGHMTVAASIVVAAVLVLPPRLRGLAALFGAAYAAVTGIATLSAGWHRPSDAIAALLVVGAWAAAAGWLLIVAQRRDAATEPTDGHPQVVAVMALLGAGLLVLALLALGVTDQGSLTPPGELSRTRLFAAYAGGAAGVAGATCIVIAVVLATVHRVVPHRGVSDPPEEEIPRMSVESGSD